VFRAALELAPTIAAIINGLLAAVIGALNLLTTDRRRRVYSVALGIIALFVVAAAVASQAARDAQDEARRTTIALLNDFYASGQTLFTRTLDNAQPIDADKINEWTVVVNHALLARSVGMAARWQADAGLTTFSYDAAANDRLRDTALNYLSHRLQRLDQLIIEQSR